MIITRHNIDNLIDAGKIECALTGGRWNKIRRDGNTKKWKKDADRILIPFKVGFSGYGSINETDFKADGTLNPELFRLKEE